MKKLVRRVLLWAGIAIVVLAVGFGILLLVLRHPLPVATAGPQADRLAHALERSVGSDGWRQTGAVSWVFRGSRHHLWDRHRQFARVRWDDVEVLVDIRQRTGVARRAGHEVSGEAGRLLLQDAYAYWANDSFWLSAIFKLFDPGVKRGLAHLGEGSTGLLVTYSSGGVTPGDSYLWIPGSDGRPRAWRMWVSILPVGGLELSVGEWTRLRTGALVPTRHCVIGLCLLLTEVDGARSLSDLVPGPDPFTVLATH